MKDKPWNLTQTWLVGRIGSGVDLQMPQTFLGPSPKFGVQKHQILDHFLRDIRSRHRMSPERNVASTPIYNTFSKSWSTFRDLWPRNSWDPFAYCDPPFGGHYVVTIKVVTSLVSTIFSKPKDFSRSRAVKYTENVVISRKRCKI